MPSDRIFATCNLIGALQLAALAGLLAHGIPGGQARADERQPRPVAVVAAELPILNPPVPPESRSRPAAARGVPAPFTPPPVLTTPDEPVGSSLRTDSTSSRRLRTEDDARATETGVMRAPSGRESAARTKETVIAAVQLPVDTPIPPPVDEGPPRAEPAFAPGRDVLLPEPPTLRPATVAAPGLRAGAEVTPAERQPAVAPPLAPTSPTRADNESAPARPAEDLELLPEPRADQVVAEESPADGAEPTSRIEALLRQLRAKRAELSATRKASDAAQQSAPRAVGGQARSDLPKPLESVERRLTTANRRYHEKVSQIQRQIILLEQVLQRTRQQVAVQGPAATGPPTSVSPNSPGVAGATDMESPAAPATSMSTAATEPDSHDGESPLPVTDDVVDRLALADSLFGSGRVKLALGIYLKAKSEQLSDPERAWVHHQIGNCYRRLGKTSDAERNYRIVVGLAGEEPLGRYARWWLDQTSETEKLRKRLGSLQAVITAGNPTDPPSLNVRQP